MEKPDREQEIIHHLLSLRGISRYKLVGSVPEGKTLPGGIDPIELDAHSGVVVTPGEAYHFWLRWEGAEQGSYTLAEDAAPWQALDVQKENGYIQEQIRAVQQELASNSAAGTWSWNWSGREPGQATEREHEIIGARLLRAGFEHFALLDIQSDGQDLVGSLYPGEVQAITALLVLPYEICRLTLAWNWEASRYTFGEEQSALLNVEPDTLPAELKQHVEEAQSSLRAAVERETEALWSAFAQEYREVQEEEPDAEATRLFWERVGGAPRTRAERSVLSLPQLEKNTRRRR